MNILTRIKNSIQWRWRLFKKRYIDVKRLDVPCNICGNHRFTKGPNERLSLTDEYPWCLKCWSLERHRGLRLFWESFDLSELRTKQVLQFSHDPAVKPEWFANHTISIYNGMNSLDVQKIDKPDHSYDIVLCNQVIEHVPDDHSSIRELLRITKPDGFVQLGVPYPMERETTIEWEEPNMADHGHYRNYGSKDIRVLLDNLVGEGKWQEIIVEDPVTKATDYIYLLCHSKEALERVKLLRS